jgi:hypothetical protein
MTARISAVVDRRYRRTKSPRRDTGINEESRKMDGALLKSEAA